MKLPELIDIENAYKRINKLVHKTPVFKSELINHMFDTHIYFKCENLQKVGAFKYRGASNAVSLLNEEQLSRGVITHSSGNHAQALALAAKNKRIKAYIIMPNNSPSVKINAVKSYGAEIIFCEPNLTARETTCNNIMNQTGATFIHPYNNFNVICGQGTAAYEFLEEIPDLDLIITPVGGGGLLAGTATAAKGFSKNIKVLASEPDGANDAYLSLQKGYIIPSIEPKTIADGLLTSLGELNFEIIKNKVDDIITVTDDSIKKAMKLIWERLKLLVEPSAAVTLAGFVENKLSEFKHKKVGLILSGGNIDFENFKW